MKIWKDEVFAPVHSPGGKIPSMATFMLMAQMVLSFIPVRKWSQLVGY